MDTLCPQHGLKFKWIEPGVSKNTGKPYQGFWACPERGCKMKPNQPVGQPVQPTYQPVKNDKMSKEDWEEKDKRKNKDILLQVAFKAAVELITSNRVGIPDRVALKDELAEITLYWHQWLLSQTEGQTPSKGIEAEANSAIDSALNVEGVEW